MMNISQPCHRSDRKEGMMDIVKVRKWEEGRKRNKAQNEGKKEGRE